MFVVDLAEVEHVDDRDREGLVVPDGLGDESLQAHVEPTAVEDPRERVQFGLAREPALQPQALSMGAGLARHRLGQRRAPLGESALARHPEEAVAQRNQQRALHPAITPKGTQVVGHPPPREKRTGPVVQVELGGEPAETPIREHEAVHPLASWV